jgi:multidrug efflux pump subunit AcrA (membrane-fusion protein)
MNSITRVFVAFLVILSALLLSSCGKPGTTNNGDKVQPVNVRIEILKPSRLIDGMQISGTVKASEDANLSPEEGGVVKEWKVKKGQSVKKGDLIVMLKDEVLKAGYDAAAAQYNMAQLNLEKQRKVYDEQGISELQLKNLEYGRDAAKANADLMKARWERTQIRSPFDGPLPESSTRRRSRFRQTYRNCSPARFLSAHQPLLRSMRCRATRSGAKLASSGRLFHPPTEPCRWKSL